MPGGTGTGSCETCLFPYVFVLYGPGPCSFSNPRSDPRSQAGASLVWGHEKLQFEDHHGFQWRGWFNECGRAFKIKAAWGHPDIVSGARTRTAPMDTNCDYFT